MYGYPSIGTIGLSLEQAAMSKNDNLIGKIIEDLAINVRAQIKILN